MRGLGWLSVPGLMLLAPVARACTVCHSRVGDAVRAGIFDGHFLHTAAVTAAPFPIFLGVGLWLRFKLPLAAELPVTEELIGAEGLRTEPGQWPR